MSTELTVVNQSGAALFRASTDAAGLCKDIVTATAKNIQGRKYVQCEGWQAIAIAHGCVASAGNVERIETGYRAIGRVVRMDTGAEIATAEGFVGDDEKTWASRPEFARRAMAQTRAISRACRSAFAHVVVMMNAGLSTTPAEEMDGVTIEHDKVDRATGEVTQPDDGWLEKCLDSIANATGTSTLKAEFEAAQKEAKRRRDSAALERIVSAKDAKKALLATPAKPAPHADAIQAIADMGDDLPFQAAK